MCRSHLTKSFFFLRENKSIFYALRDKKNVVEWIHLFVLRSLKLDVAEPFSEYSLEYNAPCLLLSRIRIKKKKKRLITTSDTFLYIKD